MGLVHIWGRSIFPIVYLFLVVFLHFSLLFFFFSFFSFLFFHSYFYLFFFVFRLYGIFLLLFLRFSSLSSHSPRGHGQATAIYCKNGEFHSDPVCTDRVQNFPITGFVLRENKRGRKEKTEVDSCSLDPNGPNWHLAAQAPTPSYGRTALQRRRDVEKGQNRQCCKSALDGENQTCTKSWLPFRVAFARPFS